MSTALVGTPLECSPRLSTAPTGAIWIDCTCGEGTPICRTRDEAWVLYERHIGAPVAPYLRSTLEAAVWHKASTPEDVLIDWDARLREIEDRQALARRRRFEERMALERARLEALDATELERADARISRCTNDGTQIYGKQLCGTCAAREIQDLARRAELEIIRRREVAA